MTNRGAEAGETFACFGSSCTVFVTGDGRDRDAEQAVAMARRRLLDWHERFSRFEPGSELSRLNADPRDEVPVTPAMAQFARSVVQAAEKTGGLVNATLVDEIETAGYTGDLRDPVPLEVALRLAPGRRPAGPSPVASWRSIAVDQGKRTVTRPPGVKLDSGGLAKGMFADLLAGALRDHTSFAVDCAGDVRVGGTPREVRVASPFDDGILHAFELTDAGVATSGIGKRSWLDADGRPAHHLLDPATGSPAFTGVVQVTALAPSALTAEMLAKAAVLSGPEAARTWLRYGGVVVFDDGSHQVVEQAIPRHRVTRKTLGA